MLGKNLISVLVTVKVIDRNGVAKSFQREIKSTASIKTLSSLHKEIMKAHNSQQFAFSWKNQNFYHFNFVILKIFNSADLKAISHVSLKTLQNRFHFQKTMYLYAKT